MAWAGPWDDEVLEDGAEREVAGAASQEGELGWDLAEDLTIEAVLLTLLADDRADTSDKAVVTNVGEECLDVWEGGKNNIGERRCKGDSVHEVVDREVVRARQDGLAGERVEGTVCVQLVELLLSADDLERAEHEVAVGDVGIARHVHGDVRDQLREKGDFEKLIEGNEAERDLAIALKRWRWWAIGKGATGLLLNLVELSRWVLDVGKAIGEREVEDAVGAVGAGAASG